MSTLALGWLFFVVTFLFLFSGMPVAFALGAVALVFMLGWLPPIHLEVLAETVYGELNNFAMLTIPMFVLMGAAISKSRASSDLYTGLHRWMNRLPGGLGVANVLACTVFAALCGSSPATCSAIGSMGIPEMRDRGYPASLAAGIIAAGGTLGILIPPSITLILYGLASGTSIGQLFLAGVIPGLMLSLFFCIYVVFEYRRQQRLARSAGHSAESNQLLREERYSWRERFAALPRIAPFVILVVAIMAAMYGGWATPSELAGLGAFLALAMVIVIYRCWHWRDLGAILRGTVRESTMIMMIIAMAALFTYVMNQLGLTRGLATWLVSLDMTKWVFFVGVNVLLIVLGFFLPPVAIIVMVTPILLPALTAHGFDLIWFGIVMTILLEMGLIHPPVGLNLFVINGIAPDIAFAQLVRGVLPFLAIMALAIVVMALAPELATWLPSQVYGGGR